MLYFFFQAEDGIRDKLVTGVQTCALPISWLMVIAGISLGRPALIAACRAGFCPWPAVSTWPRTTSDTSAASTLARANPSWITRSEERRVGKECRAPTSPYSQTEKPAQTVS